MATLLALETWYIVLPNTPEGSRRRKHQAWTAISWEGGGALRGALAAAGPRPGPLQYGTVMTLPYLGMFYGLHQWIEAHLGFGARTIALIDTMADSPLGQVAMTPFEKATSACLQPVAAAPPAGYIPPCRFEYVQLPE